MTGTALADIATNNNNPTCDETTIGATSGSTELEAQWNRNTINLKWYGATGEITTVGNTSKTCLYDGAITLPTEPTRPGYTFNRWVVRSTNILASLDTSINGDHYYGHGLNSSNEDYCSIDGSWSTSNCSDANLTELGVNEWKTEFSYGTIYGKTSCQSTPPSNPGQSYLISNFRSVLTGTMEASQYIQGYAAIEGAEKAGRLQQALVKYSSDDIDGAYEIFLELIPPQGGSQYTTSSTGQYCWCQVSGYKADGSNTKQPVASLWAFFNVYGSPASCASNCAYNCGLNVGYGEALRVGLFGSVAQ